MVSDKFQINWAMVLFWRTASLTLSAMVAWPMLGTCAAGVIAPMGAEWSKPLLMHHGRPCFFISFCRSRRVMSRPTA